MPQPKSYNLLILNEIRTDSAFISVIKSNPQLNFKYKILKLQNFNQKDITKIGKYSGLVIIIDKLDDTNILQIESLLNTIGKEPILVVIETIQFTSEFQSYSKSFFQSFGSYIHILFIDTSKIENAYNIHSIITSQLEKFANLMDEKHRLIIADARVFSSSRDYPEWMLVEKFIDLTLPSFILDHYNKLRLMYYAILKYGIKQTLDYDSWIFSKLRENKNEWNYTNARFYCMYIWMLLKKNNYINVSFETLVENHPELDDENLIYDYYRKKDLDDPYSSTNWIEPTIGKLDVFIPGVEIKTSPQESVNTGCLIS